MNILSRLRNEIIVSIKNLFDLDNEVVNRIDLQLNVGKDKSFGDLSCNAAMMLAKVLKQNPRQVATAIKEHVEKSEELAESIASIEIAGPGFLNVTLNSSVWSSIVSEMFTDKAAYFALDENEKKLSYSIEFVSANPTGPLHLGAGRNGIIGDVLQRVLMFLGHSVHREYLINDAGNQIKLLGESFRARCMQALGIDSDLPEGGYEGDYLVELAQNCSVEFGDELKEKDDVFFAEYAKKHMLQLIKKDLEDYGVEFDSWVSEKRLHDDGSVQAALDLLKSKKLAYEKDGALWFKATEFGDDKDRVVKKSTGIATYIAGDIAYHKDKFERGYDKIIDILGQDHHGYVKRLKATMEALGYDSGKLDVILYQVVRFQEGGVPIKMSKRAGIFTKLRDVIDMVGKDIARFFYLNRKVDAHLDFDLSLALKKTSENPVFYIQYAFVRGNSIFEKASETQELRDFIGSIEQLNAQQAQVLFADLGDDEINVIKKIASLYDVLRSVAASYQTHQLAYYSWELAHAFHTYYASNRIVDADNKQITQKRLLLTKVVHDMLGVCLNLLGVSCPEKM